MLNLVYCPPKDDHKELENCFESSLSKWEILKKYLISAGNFNINLLDFDASKKVQTFVNLRTVLKEEKYKTYKILFESIKQKSRKSYYSKQILQYKNNIKKT